MARFSSLVVSPVEGWRWRRLRTSPSACRAWGAVLGSPTDSEEDTVEVPLLRERVVRRAWSSSRREKKTGRARCEAWIMMVVVVVTWGRGGGCMGKGPGQIEDERMHRRLLRRRVGLDAQATMITRQTIDSLHECCRHLVLGLGIWPTAVFTRLAADVRTLYLSWYFYEETTRHISFNLHFFQSLGGKLSVRSKSVRGGVKRRTTMLSYLRSTAHSPPRIAGGDSCVKSSNVMHPFADSELFPTVPTARNDPDLRIYIYVLLLY